MARSDEVFRSLLGDLRRHIDSSFAPGHRLPSKRELAAMHGVGPTTIHRALLRLKSEGLICPASRVGWFRAGGRQSRSQTTLRVGIVSRRAREEWNSQAIYPALLKESQSRGISVIEVPNRHRRRPTPELARIQLSRVQWNAFDVALLVEAEDTIVLGDPLLRQHKVVAVDQDATAYGIDSVAYNDWEVGCVAARHLYALGHRRFAIAEEFSDPGFARDPNWTARRLGYESAIGQLGGAILPEWRLMVPHRCRTRQLMEFLPATVACWVKAGPRERPTALFAPVGASIHPLMIELAKHRMTVPRDLSIITVGSNGHTIQVENLSFTSIDVKVSNLASRSFDAAEELAAEPIHAAAVSRAPRLIFAPALLVPGISTAPPRS